MFTILLLIMKWKLHLQSALPELLNPRCGDILQPTVPLLHCYPHLWSALMAAFRGLCTNPAGVKPSTHGGFSKQWMYGGLRE